ncbi:hypothetical protein A33M_1700 [Rhodovulum sp. PH10]|nr:hypothetical protein A33M_1700 [Rhodovulum sp. PH10]
MTEVEDGPPIMRVQARTVVEKIGYSIVMTDAQCADFRAFAVETLDQSTRHFLMPVPIPGTGYVQRRCWFDGGTYSIDESGSHYVVSFTLCVLPYAS